MTAAELGRALADILANEEGVTAMLAAEMGVDGGFRVAVETLDSRCVDTSLTFCESAAVSSFAKLAVGCWRAERQAGLPRPARASDDTISGKASRRKSERKG